MPADRYSRQVILPQLGIEGQRRLSAGKVLLVGCGGTGAAIAQYLVRAGIGRLTILDRDVVEASNLHRQLMFEDRDIGSPKAYIAAERLKAINPDVETTGLAEDFSAANAETLVGGADIVLDGTDNMETRFVINDACVRLGRPWIYVGAVATYGMMAFFDPSSGPCVRCFLPNIPQAGSVPTCQTAGVLNTMPGIMGGLAATEAIKFLSGERPSGKLTVFDAWTGQYNQFSIAKRPDCPCCVKKQFQFLQVPARTRVAALCGSDSVQITPPGDASLDLVRLASALKRLGKVDQRELWLLFDDGKHRLTIFRNGRVLVSGTSDEKTARALYSKYIGN